MLERDFLHLHGYDSRPGHKSKPQQVLWRPGGLHHKLPINQGTQHHCPDLTSDDMPRRPEQNPGGPDFLGTVKRSSPILLARLNLLGPSS